MNEIEILFNIDKSPYGKNTLRGFVENILSEMDIDNWLMGLLITGNQEIQEYNRQWRGIDSPTDVLSFVQSDGDSVPTPDGVPTEAGDIVVSLERVQEQASELGRSTEEELRRVIIHGILHLNGMEHPGDDYDGKMLSLQEELVAESEPLAVEN